MKTGMLLVDSHLDLAFNALQLNRDLTQPAAAVRTLDGGANRRMFGDCTVTIPELRRGRVGIVFGTIMTRVDPRDERIGTAMYCQQQCYAIGMGHAAYYKALEREGLIRLIHRDEDLEDLARAWNDPKPDTPIGLVLAMECADPILDPDQVQEWYELGLRVVGIAHYGANAYSHGTGSEGGLLPRAKPLIDAFREIGIALDMSHFTDKAFWEVLELYDGPLLASHHNCRSLVAGQRQLTDEMIRAIAGLNGIIGISMDAWMLDPEWNREVPAAQQQTRATLETAADHIDHICQLLGSDLHAGIGSDLDGGFGSEQSPRDLNTIADLQKLFGILAHRGYTEESVARILSGNWLRLLREILD